MIQNWVYNGVATPPDGTTTEVPIDLSTAIGAAAAYAAQAQAAAALATAAHPVVSVGTNLTFSAGVVSMTASNIAGALGYVPYNPANNLSDLTSVPTARTNLGLGSLATLGLGAGLSVSTGNLLIGPGAITATMLQGGAAIASLGYAPLNPASNLSDIASASTARANLGLGGAALLNVGTTAGTVASGNDSRITGAVQSTLLGVNNGVATLDANGTLVVSQLPAFIVGNKAFQGLWNAATNTPTLTSSSGTQGNFYTVGVAGSTTLNGISAWAVGDEVIFENGTWAKVPNPGGSVVGVAGLTGNVAGTALKAALAIATGDVAGLGALATLGIGSGLSSNLGNLGIATGAITASMLASSAAITNIGFTPARAGSNADITALTGLSGISVVGDTAAASWIEGYLPGSSGYTPITVAATTAANYSAMIAATKTSLNTGVAPQSLIAFTGYNLVDNTTKAHNSWAEYLQTIIKSTAVYAQAFGVENSIANYATDSVAVDPFSTAYGSSFGSMSFNARLNSGVGTTSNAISALISLTNNGGRAKSGIVFGYDSLVTGSGQADAIAFGPNHALTWYKSAGSPLWKIYSNANTGSLSQILLQNNSLLLSGAKALLGTNAGNPIAQLVVAGSDTVRGIGNTAAMFGSDSTDGSSLGAMVQIGSINGINPFIGASKYGTSNATASPLSVYVNGAEAGRFDVDGPHFRLFATATPLANTDLVIQATSNTSLTFKYKGSDGTVRSGSITLA